MTLSALLLHNAKSACYQSTISSLFANSCGLRLFTSPHSSVAHSPFVHAHLMVLDSCKVVNFARLKPLCQSLYSCRCPHSVPDKKSSCTCTAGGRRALVKTAPQHVRRVRSEIEDERSVFTTNVISSYVCGLLPRRVDAAAGSMGV